MINKEQKQMLNRIRDHTNHAVSLYNDPMNGCPQDFAEDDRRTARKLTHEAYKLGITDEQILKAELKGNNDAAFNIARMHGEYHGKLGFLKWQYHSLHDFIIDKIDNYKWRCGARKARKKRGY
jgi:hypothetical protein